LDCRVAFVVKELLIAGRAVWPVSPVVAGFRIYESDDIRHVVRAHVQQPRRRIERGSGPVRSAMIAGDYNGPFQARRMKRRAAADRSEFCKYRIAIGITDIGDVRFVQELGGEWWRLDGNRLCRRGLFAGDI